MNKRILLMLVSIVLLTSCKTSNTRKTEKPTSNDNSKNTEVYSTQSKATIQKTPYRLWIQDQEYVLGMYEPKDGAYIGAYVLSNQGIDFDMNKFDRITNKKHGTYLRNMRLGEPFPQEWVLKCIANMKTPYIILHPPTEEYPYQEHLLEEMARKFGEFYVPMFVEFYPNPSNLYGDGKAYKEFYQTARKTFSQYASNVAFIWSIDSKNIYDGYVYYPGDDFVDWIGLNLYIPIYQDGIKYYEDPMKILEDFYFIYQEKKPLMISQLGISHYSKIDHRYYMKEASHTLESIYDAVYQKYPRIKGINYMDFDNIKVAPKQQGMDNFSITEQPELLQLYQKLIQPDYFLNTVDMQNSGFLDDEWFVLPDPVYKKEDQFYVPDTVLLQKRFSDVPDSFYNEIVRIEENKFFPLDAIIKYMGYELYLDDDKKIIYIKR